MPSIELVDLKKKLQKREMNGHFSDTLLQQIHHASKKEQVILFQNKRGFSTIVECKIYDSSPQCPSSCKFNISQV